jgi:hypothetical protein
MFFNPWTLPALALAGLLYAIGRAAAGRFVGKRSAVLRAGSALLCLPALSFILYYLHLIHEPVWYAEWRSLNGVEVLSGLCGLPAGLWEPGPALAQRLTSIRTLLGSRPGLRLGLLLTVMPFLKPIIFPIAWGNTFTNTWSEGVCKQSTMATCGACSLATVFRALGVERTEESVARGSYTCGTGTENWYLLRYARANGLKARAVRVSGITAVTPPAILGVKISGGAGHFIVYIGRDHGNLMLGDPLSGRILATPEDFSRLFRFTGEAMEFSR